MGTYRDPHEGDVDDADVGLLEADLDGLDGGGLVVPLVGDGRELDGHVGFEVGEGQLLLADPVLSRPRSAVGLAAAAAATGDAPCLAADAPSAPTAAEDRPDQVAGTAHDLVGVAALLDLLSLFHSVRGGGERGAGPLDPGLVLLGHGCGSRV